MKASVGSLYNGGSVVDVWVGGRVRDVGVRGSFMGIRVLFLESIRVLSVDRFVVWSGSEVGEGYRGPMSLGSKVQTGTSESKGRMRSSVTLVRPRVPDSQLLVRDFWVLGPVGASWVRSRSWGT